MDWAEDLKFSIRKTTAKMGRRAAAAATGVSASTSTNSASKQSPSSPSSPDKDNSLNLNFDISLGDTEPQPNKGGPPRRISGGWADSATKSGKSRKYEDERFKAVISIDGEDDNIPIIPDLDDIQDELLMNEIVNPPSVTVNRVVTLNELNSDLLTQKAFSSLEDIDLSILTKCLRTQDELDEPDELWEWDKLFTEITAEIHEDEKEKSTSSANINEKISKISNAIKIDDIGLNNLGF